MWWMLGMMVVAHGGAPDRAASSWAVGSSAVTGLSVSSHGRLVGGIVDGAAVVLDTETWTMASAAPCTVRALALEVPSDDESTVWVGCASGTVDVLTWTPGALDTSADLRAVDLADDAVVGVWLYEAGDLLYAVTEGDGAAPLLHTIGLSTGDADEGSFPVALARTGFLAGVTTSDRLVIAHGGDDMSQMTLGGSAPTINPNPYAYSIDDVAPSIRSTVYAVDSSGVLLEYQPSSFVYSLLVTDLDSPSVVTASLDSEDEWLLVGAGSQILTWPMTLGVIDGDVSSFDAGDTFGSLAVARWGYAFGGGSGGALTVLTENPWVSDVQTSASTALQGDTPTVSFEVDRAVTWTVVRGGDASGVGGEELSTGGLDEGGAVVVELLVDDAWVEGDNDLYVFVEDSLGRVGHGYSSIYVDNPPDAPSLDSSSITFGDQRLTVTFDELLDGDLDHYTVYVTTSPFDAEDWPTGGPSFDGDDALEAPRELAAGTPGEEISLVLAPLTNDVTYYVAVRATDQAGFEGAMSDVVEGTPRQTYSAAEIAGDPGGYGCRVLGSGGMGWAGLWGLGVVVGRRRGGRR